MNMDMSSSMDMGSVSMTMESTMASMTQSMETMMSMDHGSMSMDHGSMTMDHGSMNTDSMDMGGDSMGMNMGDMSMNMHFTNNYKEYPLLFQTLKASNGGEAFGLFVLLFFIGVLTKGVEFLRNFLEHRVWHNPDYGAEQHSVVGLEKNSSDEEVTHVNRPSPSSSLSANIIRNVIRLVLCFIPELFSFCLMLAAMSFSLVYFFAAVSGLSVGRFIFERISHHYGIQPIGISSIHH